MSSRPMHEPPSFWRMLTSSAATNLLAAASGLFVALFLLGWTHP